ncbi:MAG: diacylglycerol kinase family protein [Bacteroidota bacterium]
MSFTVIYNPTSGRGKGKKVTERFRQYLLDNSISAQFIETDPEVELAEKIHHLSDNSNVIVIGGDGTFYDVVNAIKNLKIPLSFLPAGTGNDFVKMLDIGSNEQETFDTAINGKTMQIDAGDCNGKIFLNGVGIGFDGQIVAAMQNKKKWLSGQAAYYYEVLRILSTYQDKPFHFSLDSTEFTKNLILLTIGNGSTFGGGFKLTPHANISDGLLDICEIGKISPLNRYLNLPKLQNGTHHKMSAVNMHQAKEITIEENNNLNAHIDGEYLGTPPFRIKVLPAYLCVKVKHG